MIFIRITQTEIKLRSVEKNMTLELRMIHLKLCRHTRKINGFGSIYYDLRDCDLMVSIILIS